MELYRALQPLTNIIRHTQNTMKVEVAARSNILAQDPEAVTVQAWAPWDAPGCINPT